MGGSAAETPGTAKAVPGDPDLCASCGNQFPPRQVCSRCLTDRAAILCAVGVLKRRGWKRKFASLVIIRVLERYADDLAQEPR